MDAKTIAGILAALTSSTTLVACDRTAPAETTDPSETPARAETTAPAEVSETEALETEGEHACGNHAEGACGGEASPDPVAVRSFDVAPGKFAEANFEMAAGSTVTAKFERGRDVEWDVHSHGHDGGVTIHARGTGPDGEVAFTAPTDGVYSILWKNVGTASTALDVSLELGNGATLHSWIPD